MVHAVLIFACYREVVVEMLLQALVCALTMVVLARVAWRKAPHTPI